MSEPDHARTKALRQDIENTSQALHALYQVAGYYEEEKAPYLALVHDMAVLRKRLHGCVKKIEERHGNEPKYGTFIV